MYVYREPALQATSISRGLWPRIGSGFEALLEQIWSHKQLASILKGNAAASATETNFKTRRPVVQKAKPV